MDKIAIKKFAIEARRSLINEIRLKAVSLGIDDNGVKEKLAISTADVEYYIDERDGLTGKDIVKRQKLVSELKQRAKNNDFKTALNDLIEEVAYTWFNRIIAIRFMEVNDYLPSRTRVLSSSEGRNEPDIMVHPLSNDLLMDKLGGLTDDEQKIIIRAEDTEATIDQDVAYRMLFIKQANALNANLPYLFEQTNDYAELLFTPNYHDGVIQHLIHDISEDDFNVAVGGQVEIIGWLYQYYNSEPHDQVINITGGPVMKNDIPAATQLFTTDWVVKYMVDNSLGKYWLERNPDSHIKGELTFLLPGKIDYLSDVQDVTDIKLIDNAMGSGHILVYAFDVLMKMYLEQGYSSREAASSIIQNNLYGLEIDRRAFQLAYFALMMKARQYNRRALMPDKLKPNVFVFEDTNTLSDTFINQLPQANRNELLMVLDKFHNARELGSITRLGTNLPNIGELKKVVNNISVTGLDVFGILETKHEVLTTLTIAQVLSQKYEIAVTNPPYLNKMDPDLKKYVKKYYGDYSGDLFSVFIFNNSNLVKTNGYAAFMTPFVWMFIKTYEKLRNFIVKNKKIDSLIQMEYSAFEEATVPINTFIIKNTTNENTGTYLKLSAFKGGMNVQKERVLAAITDPSVDYLYRTNQANFSKIPGMPIAYWASEQVFRLFDNDIALDAKLSGKEGLGTGNNAHFLRFWFEISGNSDGWFPYQKGGSYRKWYGNNLYKVNWKNNGAEMKSLSRSNIRNLEFQNKVGITWSAISSGKPSFRFSLTPFFFDSKGPMMFKKSEDISYTVYLGLLNSKVSEYILSFLSPTLDYRLGQIQKIPLLMCNENNKISKSVNLSIDITKEDWDYFETSWDFQRHPFLMHIADDKQTEVDGKVQNAFRIWQEEAKDRFEQLKANEESLNRIFIDLYGLNDELTPEVADKDVSVRLADEVRDVKSFLSYFVGVVFGRYSLNTDGLTYAGGDWDRDAYRSFKPNEDNLLLLNDANYFDDSRDIMNRLREFLTVTFGEKNVDENLEYLASVVGKKADTAEMAVRRYFAEDFFKDHLKIYQKRPIYWEFNSGKRDGFKALMYLHRYDRNELAMLRTNYLHPLQGKYETKIDQLTQLVNSETVISQKKRYEKVLKHVGQQLTEIKKYDPIIQHIANQQIALDLDDGVVVNYKKLQIDGTILSKIK